MKNLEQYNLLANLFRYPGERYKENAEICGEFMKQNYPDAYKTMEPFLKVLKEKSDFEIENIFNKTFHIQAICYLDLGYVLFAEDYKRGDFLVHIKKEQEMAENDCGEELADNLPNVLTLLPLLKDKEFLGELSVRIMIPALRKMIKEFDSSRIELKAKVMKKKQKVIILEDLPNKNIYQYAIQAALEVLEADFGHLKYDDPEIKPDLTGKFLSDCGSCSVSHTTPQQKAS
jgi:nitrate reductase assembly molybdenum cofactor insertion protein NarJ